MRFEDDLIFDCVLILESLVGRKGERWDLDLVLVFNLDVDLQVVGRAERRLALETEKIDKHRLILVKLKIFIKQMFRVISNRRRSRILTIGTACHMHYPFD